MALQKLREDFGYFLPPSQATPLYYVTNLVLELKIQKH